MGKGGFQYFNSSSRDGWRCRCALIRLARRSELYCIEAGSPSDHHFRIHVALTLSLGVRQSALL